MAGITGTNLYLKFGSTVLDTDYRSFSAGEEMNLVDESAGSDTARSYLTTLKDGTASATIVIQAGDTGTWAALTPGTSGTLEWGQEGTAATKPKHTVTAIVSSREMSMEYAYLVVADIEWQISDPNGIVDDTY